jgi:hypothetical protein
MSIFSLSGELVTIIIFVRCALPMPRHGLFLLRGSIVFSVSFYLCSADLYSPLHVSFKVFGRFEESVCPRLQGPRSRRFGCGNQHSFVCADDDALSWVGLTVEHFKHTGSYFPLVVVFERERSNLAGLFVRTVNCFMTLCSNSFIFTL